MAVGLAVLAGLVLGWGLIATSEVLARPTTAPSAQTIELFLGDQENNPEYAVPADQTPIIVPLDPEYEVYLHVDPDATSGAIFVQRFTVDEVSLDRPMAAHFAIARTIMKVSVNGHQIYASSQKNAWTGNQGYAPIAFMIPNDVLQSGENVLSFVQGGIQRKIAPVVTIGNARPIMRAVWWSDLFSSLLPSVSVALLIFVAVLFLVVQWPRQDRWRAYGIVALLVTWTLYNLNVLGFPTGVGNPWRSVIGYVTPYLLVTGFVFSVLTWMGARWYWLAGAGLASLVCTGGVILAGFDGSRAVYEWGWPIEVWSKMLLAPVLVLALAWHNLKSREIDTVELIAYTACLFAVFVDGTDDRFGIILPLFPDLSLTFYSVPWFAIVFALGMCASIATQATRARRIAVAHSDILEEKLSEREEELAAAFSREQDVARERTLLEERRRLMRDMHDGIGGQLVSLILQSRSGQVQIADVSRSLSAMLEDLRLIVDSLDTAGDSLTYAIGAFRNRLEPKLRESGVDFVWDVDPDIRDLVLGPDAILQVLRILQEACSNAIQHSGADRLTVSLSEDEAGSLQLAVTDTGRGIPDGAPQGKGLQSMRSRAARLGADLAITSLESGGTRVQLTLSPPEEALQAKPAVA